MTVGDRPRVSVVTPAYNAARFLEQTIRSVQAQSFTDWEQIVVDDGSVDGTRDVVRRLARGDSRIRLLERPNEGAARARNAGMTEARGRYLAFLDSDDLWVPEKLQEQVRHMEGTGSVFSFTGYSLIDEEGRSVGRPVRIPARMSYRDLLENTIIGCLTVMLDRLNLGDLEMPPLPQHEDLALWFRILKSGVSATGIQRDLARYRIVRGSASRNKVRSALHMWHVYRSIEHLSLPRAGWSYAHYAWNAYWKNRV